ncbi:MAG: DEAD/DEAH box helicase family protein [Candidatus Scalindua sp.]|nr:DEAD/DEAH box helicase family protein [Candidatus Scalindua sp.]
MTRDERQEIILNKFKNNNYVGGFEGVTGFGKTITALKIIREYKPKSLLIVVPSEKLKEDWISHLKRWKIKGDVLIINTAYKLVKKYDMLVVDEAHRSVSEEFVTLYDNINYIKLVWFSAIIKRQDGRESLLLARAPILDTVTLEEALQYDWVAPFEVTKIPVLLTEEEKISHNKLNNEYERIVEELGYGNPMKNASFYISYLDMRKWRIGKISNKVLFIKTIEKKLHENNVKLSDYTKMIDTYFHKPTKEHEYYKKAILAKKFYQIVAKRKDLLYNAKNKLSKTLSLIDEYKYQYKFVFAQRIDFLQELSKHLPSDEVRLYHSKMKKKDKETSFKTFNDGRTKVKTMLSVKSLVEGIDIPKLSTSIITSFDSSKINKIQTWGRNIRKYKNKKVNIIYLYVPDTQEEVWLNKLQI